MSRGQEQYDAEILGTSFTSADPAVRAVEEQVTPIGALEYLPLAPRGLYYAMTAKLTLDRTAVFRVNNTPLPDEQLARRLCISVDELREARQPLVDVGLLRIEADGAVAVPLLAQKAERKRLAAERRQQFERAKASGAIEADLTPRQYASRVNGSKSPGRTPIHTPGQRHLPIHQVVGGSKSQVQDHNPSTFLGYRDLNPSGSGTSVRDASPDESLYPRGLTDCLSQGTENNQSVSPEGRAHEQVPKTRDQVRDQSPGPAEVPDRELARIGKRLQRILGLDGGWGGNSNKTARGWLSLFPEEELVEIATVAVSRTSEPIKSLGWLTKVFEGEASARGAARDDDASLPAPKRIELMPEEEALYQSDLRKWQDSVRTGTHGGTPPPKRVDYSGRKAA